MSKHCTKCGREVADGRRFCGGCGQAFLVVAAAAKLEPTDPICINCGVALNPGKRFCGSCGQATPIVVTPSGPAPEVVAQLPASSCAICGASVTPGKRFCMRCGHPSSAELTLAQPDTEVAPESPVLTCESCGALLIPGKQFCKQCGQAVAASDTQTQPKPDVAPEPSPSDCAKCGEPIIPGKRFCKQCGHAVGTTIPFPPIESLPAGPEGPAVSETTSLNSEADTAVLLQGEDAVPTQILTATTTLERLQSQSGPPLQPEQDAGLHQPLLCDFESAPNHSCDREIPPLFTTPQGFDETESALPQTPLVTLMPSLVSATKSGDEEISRLEPEVTKSIKQRTSRLLIGTLCAMGIVVIAVAAIVVFHYRSQSSAQIKVKKALSTTTPLPSAAPLLQTQPTHLVPSTAAPAPVAPEKPVQEAKKESRKIAPAQSKSSLPNTAKPQPAAPKAQRDNCSLDVSILPKMLDQADRNREEGNYPTAERQYRSVLACDTNSARARSGLELTLLDIRHQ